MLDLGSRVLKYLENLWQKVNGKAKPEGKQKVWYLILRKFWPLMPKIHFWRGIAKIAKYYDQDYLKHFYLHFTSLVTVDISEYSPILTQNRNIYQKSPH